MSMKDLLYRLQPVQLYIVLVLSIVYFLVQLFLSHITHALTLLVDSYHMLCNIIALTGCILTIKHSDKTNEIPGKPKDTSCLSDTSSSISSSKSSENFIEICMQTDGDTSSNANNPSNVKTTSSAIVKSSTDNLNSSELKEKIKQKNRQQHERTLKNTFGWTRIDVLTMLVVCIFLASLCFSLLIEALQTLSHIHHQDTMHHPVYILILGSLGLVLNGLCYLLIGGYTYHQGSFLHITSNGNVILDRIVTGESIRQGERRLSKSRRPPIGPIQHEKPKRQSVWEMFRDICSTLFVIICAIIIYVFEENEDVAKYVDPLMSIGSCCLLLYLSYPYMKESGFILLQTIPDTIDIESFKKTLLESFKEIINVHDLHIWQLSASKYVSTAHIIFQNPNVYHKIHEDVINFFHEQGINIVTIQPEFTTTTLDGNSCLMKCREDACLLKHCCERDETKKTACEKTSQPSSQRPAQKSCTAIKTKIENIPLQVQTEKIVKKSDNNNKKTDKV
uniref:Putative integral to membrane n=1 Tax=Corethrella appendiculata TaxID=1370023 RepID=U5EQ60_9DIPT